MFFDALPLETARLLIALWLFAMGAAIGSFLNVVIYRLPAGMNLSWPGSRCPLCRHPIRWFDNIPVLSWMVLRGRCRDCRAPISIRYPLVEAGTALLFLVLADDEIFHNAANLPVRAIGPDGGLAALRSPSELLAVYAYHAALLVTLLAAALIAGDGKRPPRRLFAPLLLVGLLAPLGWPQLHPVPAWLAMADCRLAGLIDGAAGLLAGVLLGLLAARIGCVPRAISTAPAPGPMAGLLPSAVCVGVVLGWQAVCILMVVAVAVHRLVGIVWRRQPEIGRLPAIAWLGFATLAWILGWAQLAALSRLV